MTETAAATRLFSTQLSTFPTLLQYFMNLYFVAMLCGGQYFVAVLCGVQYFVAAGFFGGVWPSRIHPALMIGQPKILASIWFDLFRFISNSFSFVSFF